jgi:hypothetical protein
MKTLRKGYILWHARVQNLRGPKKEVMSSPRYLYTSPQISQALYHGLAWLKNNSNRMDKYVELTKLRVKEPIHVIELKSKESQVKLANYYGINNFKPFTADDTKILVQLCNDRQDVDGWIAKWDQDQIALCERVIRKKLEVVDTIKISSGVAGYVRTSFETINNAAGFYFSKLGRRVVKKVKAQQKEKAVARKIERMRKQTTSVRGISRIAKKLASNTQIFKRPMPRK